MNFIIQILALWGMLLCSITICSMENVDPAQASLEQLLWANRSVLKSIAPDEQAIKYLVTLIENNTVDVNEIKNPTSNGESILDLMAITPGKVGFDKRILYALLRNPRFIQYQPRGPFSTLYCYSVDNLAPERLSYLLLFIPFGLAQSYTMEQSPGLITFVDEFWQRILKVFPEMADELKELQDSKNVVAYLAETKNLTIIKVIFFLATGVVIKDLTGSEKTADDISPLMLAVGGGYLQLVKKLLLLGADPLATNKYGDNALSIAEIQLQRAMVDQDVEQHEIYQRIYQLLDGSDDILTPNEPTVFNRLSRYAPSWILALLNYMPFKKHSLN